MDDQIVEELVQVLGLAALEAKPRSGQKMVFPRRGATVSLLTTAGPARSPEPSCACRRMGTIGTCTVKGDHERAPRGYVSDWEVQ
jgi:hypothetical protein